MHGKQQKLRGSRIGGSCNFAKTSDIVQQIGRITSDVHARHNLTNYYHDFAPRLEAVVHQLIQNAYLQLGWNPIVGDRFTLEQLTSQLQVVPQHHRTGVPQLGWLVEAGVLCVVGNGQWQVACIPVAVDVASELDALEYGYPRVAAEVNLQRTTGGVLAGVLCGEVDPVHLLFPSGSSELLESFYVDACDFPAYNELIPAAVEQAIKNLPERRSLRVLEVGAGTGSLTKAVLPVLPRNQTDYLFTDVGPAFLAKARHRFLDSPFIHYATFDIERDPGEQGFAKSSVDIILATNVFHATADLKSTLQKSESRVCAPGGMLLFQEVVRRRPAWDNIFGLLEGWWKYTDTELRLRFGIAATRAMEITVE